MPNYFFHLWAPPPADLALSCPVPAPGEPVDPGGFFDPATVAGAYSAAGWISLAAALLLVVLCYQLTAVSTGPRFTKRFFLFWLVTALTCFTIPVLVLRTWQTHALAGSCETNPEPFLVPLPWSVILNRGFAGLAWGLLAFFLLSLLLTRSAGRFPWAGGFFHNRGTPWPRLVARGE
ncbi:MAG: hypothetical protein WKG32_14505 [Gemmatimonadaceae bacterium]